GRRRDRRRPPANQAVRPGPGAPLGRRRSAPPALTGRKWTAALRRQSPQKQRIPLDPEAPMVKSVLVAMLVVPLILAFTLAPAGAFPRHAGAAQLKADLGLSDDQVQAIRQLHAGQRDQRVQLHASLRQARQSLRELILSNGDARDIQA